MAPLVRGVRVSSAHGVHGGTAPLPCHHELLDLSSKSERAPSAQWRAQWPSTVWRTRMALLCPGAAVIATRFDAAVICVSPEENVERGGRRAHSAATRCGARAQARAVRLLSVRAAQHSCYHMLRTKQHGLSPLRFGSVPRRRRSRARRAALPRLLLRSSQRCTARKTQCV